MEQVESVPEGLLTAWRYLEDVGKPVTNADLARKLGVSERTARSYTMKLVKEGVLSRTRIFPRDRFQVIPGNRGNSFRRHLSRLCDLVGE